MLAVGTALLAGCNSGTTGDSKTGDGAKPAADGKPIKVGVVFDSGGRGDKSFNDSAYAGVERAKSEFAVEEHDIESRSQKDYETNLSALADQGMDIVFAVGIGQDKAVAAVAPKYPNTKFAIVDSEVDAPNVRGLKFSEEQGSFLAGYLAALVSKSKKIGFVGGMSIPLIKKFEVGYAAGAMTADPSVQFLPAKYTESWDDINLGKRSAEVLFRDGADIVFCAAGRCGLGVIDAARESGKFAIGVDSNQDDVAKGTVLTSMLKRVDEAVYSTIKDVKEGKFSPGTRVYDLKSKGVGLSPMEFTKDKVGEANLKKVADVSAKIESGEIKVPSTPEEMTAFKKGK